MKPRFSGTMIIYLVILISLAGKDIPVDGDMQRLMLHAGADHVMHKVWESIVILGFWTKYACLYNYDIECCLKNASSIILEKKLVFSEMKAVVSF